jgi:hypothetical protein
MKLSTDEVKQLNRHLDTAKKALQRLPLSQAITDALATLDAVAKTFAASPSGDAHAAQSSVTKTADNLATFAVANASQGVTADVDAVIKQLRSVAALLRTATES